MYKRYYGHQEIYVSLTSVRCVTLQASLASSRVKQVWQVELLRERSYVDILREHAQLHMNVTPEYNVEIVGTSTAPSSVTNHARTLLSSHSYNVRMHATGVIPPLQCKSIYYNANDSV